MMTVPASAPVPSNAVLDRLLAVVGEANAIRDPAAMDKYLREWRDRFIGKAAMVLRPGSTAEVAQLLAIANETGTIVVPQGGNTGLVGGQIPFESGHEVVLSLERMNAIRQIDPLENTITAEAGVTLQHLQEAAARSGRLFPLSLASEGSCTLGGNLSSNAGGVNVIAYGNTRDLCLGLEVVLADGRVWNGLRRLRKDNTGYDLKDIFIGAEGTLGIITAAVMRLVPAPGDRATAVAALATLPACLELLALAQERSGGRLVAIELMPRIGIEFTLRHAATRDPLGEAHDWYVLLELAGPGKPGDLEPVLADILEAGLEKGIVTDGVIAASQAQADDLWKLREAMSEVQRLEGGSIKHDISVPVSRVPEFIERASVRVGDLVPGCRPVPFGHVGDGNVHFNVSQPVGADKQTFLARWEEINAAVHAIVLDMGGSISAEHGIGRLKRDLMPEIKSAVELDMMRRLKQLFDPRGILNPGKTIP